MALDRVFISGGAGFVGSHVCEMLLRRGTQVVVMDDLSTGSEENVAALADAAPQPSSFRFLRQSVLDPLPADLDGAPSEATRFDAVLHLASPASPPDYLRLPVETLRVNAEGSRVLLELARRHGARFVLTSTSEVYGDPLVHPQTEDYWGNVNPIGPRSVYDEGKRYAEALTMAYCRAHGVDTGILRLFNTYGPRMRVDDGRAVPVFIGQALRGEPVTIAGDGAQTRSLCFVQDTAAGIIAMAQSDAAGPINLGNPEELSIRALAAEIIELAGSTSPIIEIERPVDDPQQRRPDVALAKRTLDWAPSTSRADGLRRTIEWFAASAAQPAGH